MSGMTYRAMSRIRHLFGIHNRATFYSISPRCDWCGHRSAMQRAVAAANAKAAFEQQFEGRSPATTTPAETTDGAR